jgi:hypothetical protein
MVNQEPFVNINATDSSSAGWLFRLQLLVLVRFPVGSGVIVGDCSYWSYGWFNFLGLKVIIYLIFATP